MKFKPHFVLLFMIAACAIFVTATVGKASASVATYDCDVGWQSLNDNATEFPALNEIFGWFPEMPQEVPSVPETGWLNHESPEITPLYWPARDSKASLYKAIE